MHTHMWPLDLRRNLAGIESRRETELHLCSYEQVLWDHLCLVSKPNKFMGFPHWTSEESYCLVGAPQGGGSHLLPPTQGESSDNSF